MRVKFTRKFKKLYEKAPLKIRKQFEERVGVFIVDKFHPMLNNHALGGRYSGYRSINVTGDWRAIFRYIEEGEIALFDLLGTHSQLYK